MQKKKVMMSWSSGKDSAWTLLQLQQDPSIEVVGLFSTINQEFQRVAMHGIRVELLKKQAQALSLPIDIIALPFPCTNEDYQKIMQEYLLSLEQRADAIAFGDLYLEDVKKYREKMLENSKLEALFPIWATDTKSLPKKIYDAGFRTITTCIDTRKLSKDYLGKELTPDFIQSLPVDVDPCGENGEFHTFVFQAPNFNQSLCISIGEVVEKTPFVFIDLE